MRNIYVLLLWIRPRSSGTYSALIFFPYFSCGCHFDRQNKVAIRAYFEGGLIGNIVLSFRIWVSSLGGGVVKYFSF